MSKYRIKVGDLYVHSIWTDEKYVKTEFIKNIDLRSETDRTDFMIREDEKMDIKRKLRDVLGLVPSYEILFEEVKEEA